MSFFSKTPVSFKNILLFIFLGLSFLGWEKRSNILAQRRQEKLVEDLRASIKQEVLLDVNKNIDELVSAKVQEQYQLLAKQAEAATPKIITLSAAETAGAYPNETLEQKINRIVTDVIVKNKNPIADRDLDNYYAGRGIDPDLEVVPGVNKSPTPMQLAKEDSSAAGYTEQGDESLAAQTDDSGAVKERAESIEKTLQQRGSILLPKKTLQLEPSLTWAHFSSNRINIQGFSILPVLVIGDISTEEVKRDVFINNWAVKYGLLENLQTELKIPFRAEHDRVTTSSVSETTRSSAGIGDIEFGVSRQIGWEHGFIPDLVAAFNVKSNTGREPYNNDIGLGTGHWAARGSLIAAKSSDPAVVFGSMSYTYNFERQDIENFGDVKPGNSIGYSLGTAIALSYQTAISFSFDHSLTFKMTRDGRTISDSFLNVANFKTGLNWAINERRSVDFAVGMGLTKDSPDVTVEVRFPYTF